MGPFLQSIIIHAIVFGIIGLFLTISPEEKKPERPRGISVSTSIASGMGRAEGKITQTPEETKGTAEYSEKKEAKEKSETRPSQKPKQINKPEPERETHAEPVVEKREEIEKKSGKEPEKDFKETDENSSGVQDALGGDPSANRFPYGETMGDKGIQASQGTPGPGETASGGGNGKAEYIDMNFQLILSALRKNLRYPMAARKNGWAGKVEVSFKIDLQGEVRDIIIVKSCGYGVLDDQAMEAVKKSAPFPPPPVEATLIMPVYFDLK